MLQRLARTCYRRRRWVLVAWIVALVAAFALSSAVGGAFKTEFKLPGTESQAAYDLLGKSSFKNRQVQAQVVFAAKQGIDDPAVQQAMTKLFDEIEQKIPGVAVQSPYDNPTQISQNGRFKNQIAYAQLDLADRSAEQFTTDGDKIKSFAEGIDVPGLHIAFGGNIFFKAELGGTSEVIGILAAIIILLLAFGSVLAMGLPIGTALFGIGTGVAIVLSVRTRSSTCPTSRPPPSR